MFTILLVLQVLMGLTIIGLVLLQQGRGADVGAAFGSGASNTMFGSGGSASFLTKLTVWLAIGFFLISFGLAYTAKERAASLDQLGIPLVEAPEAEQAVPLESDIPDAPPAGDLGDGEQLTPETESVDSDIPDV